MPRILDEYYEVWQGHLFDDQMYGTHPPKKERLLKLRQDFKLAIFAENGLPFPSDGSLKALPQVTVLGEASCAALERLEAELRRVP